MLTIQFVIFMFLMNLCLFQLCSTLRYGHAIQLSVQHIRFYCDFEMNAIDRETCAVTKNVLYDVRSVNVLDPGFVNLNVGSDFVPLF